MQVRIGSPRPGQGTRYHARWLRDQKHRLDRLARHRAIGFTIAEGRAVLEILRGGSALPEARKKLEEWIARYDVNELKCLHCGIFWRSTLPRGKVPKRCQCCGGYPDVDGETMIVPVEEEPRRRPI